MKNIPSNLTELNESFHVSMIRFVEKNWIGVSEDFIVKASLFVDSLLKGRSFVNGRTVSDILVKEQFDAKKDQVNFIKNFIKRQNISDYFDKNNAIQGAEFFDSKEKNLKEFLKENTLEDAQPKKSLQEKFQGFKPKETLFDIDGLLHNEYTEYKLSQMGVPYSLTLMKNILSLKIAFYTDVQRHSVIKNKMSVSENPSDLELFPLLDKTIINP